MSTQIESSEPTASVENTAAGVALPAVARALRIPIAGIQGQRTPATVLSFEGRMTVQVESSEPTASLENAAPGVAFPAVTRTLLIPIAGGSGTQTLAAVLTYESLMTVTMTVLAPTNGSWNIGITDLIAAQTVFAGGQIPPNVPIFFTYKTGIKTQLQVEATWNHGSPEGTTLQLLLETNV